MNWNQKIVEFAPAVAFVLVLMISISLYMVVKHPWLAKRRMLRVVLLGVFISMLFVPLEIMRVARQSGQISKMSQFQGQAAPDFVFKLASDSSEVHLTNYLGKTILLNIWATWCNPCRMEIPELQKLQDKHSTNNLIVLGVSPEPLDVVQQFAKTFPVKFLVGTADPEQAATTRYMPDGCPLPTTYVIDKKGIVREVMIGEQNLGDFEKAIAGLE